MHTYFDDILNTDVSVEDVVAAKTSSEAMNHLVRASLPHVISIATRYKCRLLDNDDMIAFSLIALLQAVETFDPAKSRWVWFNYLENSVHWMLRTVVQKYNSVVRYASKDEKAEFQFESLVGEESDEVMFEDIRADEFRNYLMAKHDLKALMQHLMPLERTVLTLRHGLFSDKPQMTNKAVGQELGLTGERVRQIEKKALAYLQRVARNETHTKFIRASRQRMKWNKHRKVA